MGVAPKAPCRAWQIWCTCGCALQQRTGTPTPPAARSRTHQLRQLMSCTVEFLLLDDDLALPFRLRCHASRPCLHPTVRAAQCLPPKTLQRRQKAPNPLICNDSIPVLGAEGREFESRRSDHQPYGFQRFSLEPVFSGGHPFLHRASKPTAAKPSTQDRNLQSSA